MRTLLNIIYSFIVNINLFSIAHNKSDYIRVFLNGNVFRVNTKDFVC